MDYITDLQNDFSDPEVASSPESVQPPEPQPEPQATVPKSKQLLAAEISSLAAGQKNQPVQALAVNSDVIAALVGLAEPLLGCLETPDHGLLGAANQYTALVNREIQALYDYIKLSYAPRFSELSSIIADSTEYSRIVRILGNDLGQIAKVDFVSKEKYLLLSMAVLEVRAADLSPDRLQQIFVACEKLLALTEIRNKVLGTISSQLWTFAPNLTNIIGAPSAIRLINHVGGLEQLLSVPSCNIASTGVLSECPLVAQVPEEYRKQAVRVVAGKLVLAARIDFSKSTSDGSYGKKMSLEIQKKLEKLMDPPDLVAVKALPKPEEKLSKKRGGKKYRKFKQKYELTDLQKAQNRVAFAQKEDSIVDAFGEEIGLGLAGRNSIDTGRIRKIKQTKNQNSLSKSMQKRLANNT